MTSFLSELGGRLADRWLSLLVLPGLLYVTAIGATVLLGQHHATDAVPVEHMISTVSASTAAHSAGTLALIAAGVLMASTAAGLAGTLSGRCVELAWTMPGHRWPARLLTAWRLARWERARTHELSSIRETALAAYPPEEQGPVSAQLRHPAQPVPSLSDPPSHTGSAVTKRERIGMVQPERPTWIGDRVLAADQRVYQTYKLDLARAWPALWLIIPDTARSELGTAQDSYSAAARLTGWGMMYGVIGAWWWPALLIAAVAAGTGWLRGRRAAAVLAQLVEVAVDLYGYSLATQLGVTGRPPPADAGRLDRATGSAITDLLRKDPNVADASGHMGALLGGVVD